MEKWKQKEKEKQTGVIERIEKFGEEKKVEEESFKNLHGGN